MIAWDSSPRILVMEQPVQRYVHGRDGTFSSPQQFQWELIFGCWTILPQPYWLLSSNTWAGEARTGTRICTSPQGTCEAGDMIISVGRCQSRAWGEGMLWGEGYQKGGGSRKRWQMTPARGSLWRPRQKAPQEAWGTRLCPEKEWLTRCVFTLKKNVRKYQGDW